MKIRDMFSKDIYRNIEGVITASKVTDEQMYQELDEYVVTKELQRHFSTFFDAYKKGITGDTRQMGVWIQGFFGSGKSHFLKILSYLLENKEVDGKNAVDFFTEGDVGTRKIKDDMTIANMKLAANTPTNVILFNVESKHQTGIEEKDSLVNVFLKVFNDSLGYSTNPMVADLERQLEHDDKFDDFKKAFFDTRNKLWVDERSKVDFLQDYVVEALVNIGYMSNESANSWFNRLEIEYKISIEEFAILVNSYLELKNNNEHIVFLVDEIGQYIGGKSDLTLQLQTIVEELGSKSHGKAWVIVTSQQAIDVITDISGAASLDFSKIKARFETTLSLSSANADEVIQKRILAKNITAQNYLEADFPNHQNDINNMLQFEDSPELKLYTSAKNYADVYPFIPYQFNLLADILTEISKHSIQGANLSRGERSLLAFFKETAERNAEQDSNILVSLNQFYPSLEKWLNETDNAKVIKQAEDNSRIVPDPRDNFNVEILKILFMIKYVDQSIKPTLNNVTNLMIQRLDEDKIELRKKVQNAFRLLIGENLIRQNLQSYIFQTNEEQEVTRLINNIEITPTDFENKLAGDIFDGKIGRSSFFYVNKHATGEIFENRYSFAYNTYVDDFPYRRNINPQLEVKIISPLSGDLWENEEQLIIQSTKNQLLISLPMDEEVRNNIYTYLRVEKYVTTAFTNSAVKNFAAVKSEKIAENQELSDSISKQLDEILKHSTFYFNTSKLSVAGSDFKARLNDALQQMAQLVYHKNELVDSPKTEADINKLLNNDSNGFLRHTENQNVVNEVKKYLELRKYQGGGITITMRTLRDNFVGKEPYGFVNNDLEWAVARLFKEGEITLYRNAVPLKTTDNPSEISKAIFDRRNPEKIRVELRVKSNQLQKKMVKELGNALFGSLNIVVENDDDSTRIQFNNKAKSLIDELSNYQNERDKGYPQMSVVSETLVELNQIINARDTSTFFETVRETNDELLELADDLTDIKDFYRGKQKLIWNTSCDLISLVEQSAIKESTAELEQVVSNMKHILKETVPFQNIPKLSELNSQFLTLYTAILESKSDGVLIQINEIKTAILADLNSRELSNVFNEKMENNVYAEFDKLINQLKSYKQIDRIALVPSIAVDLQKTFTMRFTNEENRGREKPVIPVDPTKYVQQVKKVETVYLKTLISGTSRLNTEEDVNRFVNNLKSQLLKKLNEGNDLDVHL